MLGKFHHFQHLAELYHGYHAIHRYTVRRPGDSTGWGVPGMTSRAADLGMDSKPTGHGDLLRDHGLLGGSLELYFP